MYLKVGIFISNFSTANKETITAEEGKNYFKDSFSQEIQVTAFSRTWNGDIPSLVLKSVMKQCLSRSPTAL